MGKTLSMSLVELKEQRRQQAADQYFDLLRRASAPQKGDAELLVSCMEVLGRSDTDLADDIALFQEIAAAEELAATLPLRMQEQNRANAEYGELVRTAESERAAAEKRVQALLEKAQATLSNANYNREQALKADGSLPLLKDKVEAIRRGISVESLRRERIYAADQERAIHGPPTVAWAAGKND